ncbi:MAG TPA: HD domain-containing phosphohydrolase, partial [Clostridia bacterium]|nr:HD domain-containing phosphohydrolase [Clostridia bacterium]
QEILCQAGYEVVAESDPRVALVQLEQREFSVIITDQRMPGISGLELLQQARRLRPGTTRILITGVLNLDTVIEAINRGEIFRFIVKPWIREEFLATVKNSVQRYELICQNARLQGETQAFNEQLLALNHSLDEQVKLVARQNEQLEEMNRALERNFVCSLELCMHTMQTFYPSLGNQGRRVTQICEALGQVLQLAPEERRLLESSARLHDIGLVGVSRQLIAKWQETPHLLSPAERALIEQHPVLGQELAAFGSGLEQVGELIRGHHERFDGTGYPDQLRGENIPWLARLLGAAVAFASSRYPAVDALEEVKMQSGAAFDPEAVRALMRALPMARLHRKEREVMLSDLRPGMVLASGIYTRNGLLLLPEGQHLSAATIEKIENHHRVQPLGQTLTVYC